MWQQSTDVILQILLRSLFIFLPPATKLGQGYVFMILLTGGGRQCFPSTHCRWYPSMPCSRSPGGCWGVLSQHALQVVSQHVLQQVSRGSLLPAGDLLWGVGLLLGVPPPGGGLLPGDVCSHGGLLPGGWVGLLPGVPAPGGSAGGTHPTGMHSCRICFFNLKQLISSL